MKFIFFRSRCFGEKAVGNGGGCGGNIILIRMIVEGFFWKEVRRLVM